MRKHNRRLSVALTAGTMAAALVLAGCGSGTPGEPAPGNTGDPTTGEEATDGAGEGSGDAVEIEFWHRTFTPVENEWYAQVVKDFNAAQSEVVVVDQEVPADAWDQKMTAAQAAGKAPDIYTHSGMMGDAVRLGQVLPLKGLVSDESLASINDPARAVSSIDGELYGYPLLVEPQTVLFWNKDMFTAAGLDPEKPPTSWDELYEYCDALKETLSDGQFCITTAQDAVTFAWSTVGQQYGIAGHLPISDDWTTAKASGVQGYVDLLNFYKTLYDNDYIPKQALGAYVEAAPFGQEKSAMMTSGSWALSELGSDYPDVMAVTGVGPFVSFNGAPDTTTSTIGNFKWVIDAKSDAPEAAAAFMECALGGDPEVLVPFFVATQFSKAPARDVVAEAVNATPEAANASWSNVISEQVVPYTTAEPLYPWDISLAMGTAMEKAMTGVSSVEDALDEANSEIQKVIDREDLASKAPAQ